MCTDNLKLKKLIPASSLIPAQDNLPFAGSSPFTAKRIDLVSGNNVLLTAEIGGLQVDVTNQSASLFNVYLGPDFNLKVGGAAKGFVAVYE